VPLWSAALFRRFGFPFFFLPGRPTKTKTKAAEKRRTPKFILAKASVVSARAFRRTAFARPSAASVEFSDRKWFDKMRSPFRLKGMAIPHSS
jgi:hypothetical protein